jgi:hypothetical protein
VGALSCKQGTLVSETRTLWQAFETRKTKWERLNHGLIYPITLVELKMEHINSRADVDASVYQNIVNAHRCL